MNLYPGNKDHLSPAEHIPATPGMTPEEEYIHFAVLLEGRTLGYCQQQADHATTLLNNLRPRVEKNIQGLQQRCPHRLFTESGGCPVCFIREIPQEGTTP